MSAWFLIAFVWAVLLAFWWWLGMLFDAISDWHAAARVSREDAQADGERGAS